MALAAYKGPDHKIEDKMFVKHTCAKLGALLVGAILCAPVAAQELEDRLLPIDPRSILNDQGQRGANVLLTSIADLDAKDVREAPAHVQVITARQIEASGARDLMEALQLVPAFSMARDVDDVIGLAIHGNWAMEGKCLFMLNGAQLNENDFGTYAIGQRIPLDNVERIEVIVGSGSIVHGGYAALGVVNIVTYMADQQLGARAVMRSGLVAGGLTRTSTTISGAHRLGSGQEVSYMLSHVRGNRSNAFDILPDGSPVDLSDSTAVNASSFQFNYRWRSIKAFMYYMDEQFDVSDGDYRVALRDIIFGVQQDLRWKNRTTFGWKALHTDQLPWYYLDTGQPERLASNTSNQRSSLMVSASHKATTWLTLRGGAQAAQQHSAYRMRNEASLFWMSNDREVDMTDLAAHGEINLHGRLGQFTAGHRVQRNTFSGLQTAPRLAWTKSIGRVHGKLLWSRAFRMPTVMNLNYGPEDGAVLPERVETREAELGLNIGKGANVTLNVYQTRIQDPLVYVHDDAQLDNYLNRELAGTQGADLRYAMNSERWTMMAGVGLNRALAGADIPEAMLPVGTGPGYQGVPAARAFAFASWTANRMLSLRIRGSWRDRMWAYHVVEGTDGTIDLVEWPSLMLLNAGLTLRPDRLGRFAVELGCDNLLDQARPVLSPFANALSPFRLNGRELTVAVIYKFVQ